MGWNDFSLPAVSEQYDSEDGTSRQAELRQCEAGDIVDLVREPKNPHDANAVVIISVRGIRAG